MTPNTLRIVVMMLSENGELIFTVWPSPPMEIFMPVPKPPPAAVTSRKAMRKSSRK